MYRIIDGMVPLGCVLQVNRRVSVVRVIGLHFDRAAKVQGSRCLTKFCEYPGHARVGFYRNDE